MKEQIEQVREFMKQAGQDCPEHLTLPTLDVRLLRIKLHREEAITELQNAFDTNNMVEIFDSICDSLVVVFGTALACGISPKQVEMGFNIVMRSNMSKFIDGHKDASGKWIKGPSFVAPHLEEIL